MRVLVMTAMYPTPANPAFGSFVRTQVEALKRTGVDVQLLVLQGTNRKLMYPKGMIQLRRRLATDSIDLVHAHYSYVGMIARTQWKVPVVLTYHGDDLLGTVDASGQRTYLSRCVAGVGRALGDHVVDAVIVQSAQMASKFRRADVHIVPHEVDFETFRPTQRERARVTLELHPSKKYLLFAADPRNAVKRFPFARQVAEQLAARDPSVELLPVCRETQPRLALYMSACDALIFPSFQEGSPNVVKQAMACNLPIVATDVGDVRSIIENTPGCHVCDPDVDQFVDKIGDILRTRPRTQGRENVRHFQSATIAARILDVYDRTLRKHRGHAAAQG